MHIWDICIKRYGFVKQNRGKGDKKRPRAGTEEGRQSGRGVGKRRGQKAQKAAPLPARGRGGHRMLTKWADCQSADKVGRLSER